MDTTPLAIPARASRSLTRAGLFICLTLCACQAASDRVRLTGVIRDIGVLQIEPQAEPQTSFMLEDARGVPGLRKSVIVTGPGYMFCGNGTRVLVEGYYMAGSDLFPTPMLDGARIVKCGSHTRSR